MNQKDCDLFNGSCKTTIKHIYLLFELDIFFPLKVSPHCLLRLIFVVSISLFFLITVKLCNSFWSRLFLILLYVTSKTCFFNSLKFGRIVWFLNFFWGFSYISTNAKLSSKGYTCTKFSKQQTIVIMAVIFCPISDVS